MSRPLDPFERWMVQRNIEYAKAEGLGAVVARLRDQGYGGVATALLEAATIDYARREWGFTPDPACDNCEGTGIFGTNEDGVPDEPCAFCLEDAIRLGEIDGSVDGVDYASGVPVGLSVAAGDA